MRSLYKLPLLLCALVGVVGCDDKDKGPEQLPTVTSENPSQPGVSTGIPTNGLPSSGGTPTQEPGGEQTAGSVSTKETSSSQSSSSVDETTSPATTSSGSTTGGSSTSSSSEQTTSDKATSSSDSTPSTQDTTGETSDETSDPEPEPQLRRWTDGHGDIRISWDADADNLRADIVLSPGAVIDGEKIPDGPDRVYDASTVMIVSSQKTARPAHATDPAFDLMCVAPGESMLFIPGSNLPNTVFPFIGFAGGISAKAPVVDRATTLMFVGIEGSIPDPHFAMWKTTDARKFLASSCDGFDEKDHMLRKWGHNHYNIGFSGSPGRRTLRMKSKSTLKDGTTREISFPIHFDFIQPRP